MEPVSGLVSFFVALAIQIGWPAFGLRSLHIISLSSVSVRRQNETCFPFQAQSDTIEAVRRTNEPTGRRRRLAFFSASFARNVRLSKVFARSTDESDEAETSSGRKFLSKTPETFAYDADGNMVSDGRFEYVWDAENRLVAVLDRTATSGTSPTGDVRFVVSNRYDHASRRIAKTVFRPDDDGTLLLESSSAFLYDGWNPVRETRATSAATNTLSYLWGLDLDGTLQGCGGVGGLLAVSKPDGLHVAIYDANGNVSEYVSSSGTVSAHCEYSPFGAPIVSAGSAFSHQFSTKPHCDPTGLSEYQLRKYSAALGRWTSRDPIEEEGGLNLMAILKNDLLGSADFIGESRIEAYVECMADCIEANDLLDRNFQKVLLNLNGMKLPKSFVAHVAESIGNEKLARAIRGTLLKPGTQKFASLPATLAAELRVGGNMCKFLHGLGIKMGPVWIAYGVDMAQIEAACAGHCCSNRHYRNDIGIRLFLDVEDLESLIGSMMDQIIGLFE